MIPHSGKLCIYTAGLWLLFLPSEKMHAQSYVKPPGRNRPVIQSERVITVAADGTGQFTSIQDAIDEADFNTTVRIKSGVYRESILLKSFVSVEGAGTGKTVIVSDRPEPILSAYNMSGGKVSKISFEFLSDMDSPVMVSKFSVFLIEDCTFKNGSTGLLISSNSSVSLNRCSVTHQSGDGIDIVRESFGKVTESLIELNGNHGIGIQDRSSPSLEQNTIRQNGGNGISVRDYSVGKILGNFIYRNRMNGISVSGFSEPMIRNNTIAENGDSATDLASPQGRGFGILISKAGLATLTNNIITGHSVGIGRFGDSETRLSHNNLWLNRIHYLNIPEYSTDLSVEPGFRDPLRNDFRVDSSSGVHRRGEQGLTIGADFDMRLTTMRKRIEFLKNSATQELARGNWYNAYQAAQEILAIDRLDSEGKRLYEKSSKELALYYTARAAEEFQNESVKTAEHFIKMALNYQPDHADALDLRSRIESASQTSQMKFIGVIALILITFGGSLYILKKRIQNSELKRQAQWWLDDAEEHLIVAQNPDGEKLAPDDLNLARQKLGEAKESFRTKAFETCEQLANEVVRYAGRVKDAVDKYRQLQKDALYEVTAAEQLMRSLRETGFYARFETEFSRYLNDLTRAQDALVRRQYHVAKELAVYIQTSLRGHQDEMESETRGQLGNLIAETESLIIAALTGNSSADIIVAVIDFKSELEVIKNGFQGGLLSPEEAGEQVRQIRGFIEEVLRIGGQEETETVARPPKSPYEILGIKDDATIEQIKAVYHKLSMIYHPDINTSQNLGIAGDSRFKEIKQAYDYLIGQRSRSKK